MAVKLKDICSFQSGGTPSRTNNDYFHGTIPWITTVALNGRTIGEESAVEWITEKAIAESAAKVVPERSIMVGTRVGVGKVALNVVPMSTNQDIISLVGIDESRWDKGFLCKFLQSKEPLLKTQARGATIKGIKIEALSALDVPELSLIDQKSVVKTLESILDMIALRKAQLFALDDLVKARFVEMFGDCAEVVSAGVIMSEMRNGVSPSTNGKCPEKVLTLSAITQGHFDPSMWKDGLFDNPPAAEKRIHATDFYMCRGNGNKSLVGAGVYSKEDREDLVFPDTVIAARVDITRVCLPYLFIAWMQPSIRDQIEAGARTTNGTYKINQQIISKINIPLPPLNAQEQFAAFVAQVDKSKVAVQKALDEAQVLFDSLMQQYFG